MDRQQEFVLRTIEERDVRFVRLWFTDVVGSLKSVALAPAEVERRLRGGPGLRRFSIEGLARVFESDMLAQPDPSTFQILPWRAETEATSRMFCDILTPDGEPSAADPRNVLKRNLAKAADMGFTCYTHPEIEFYLLKSQQPGPDGAPVPVDEGGYFDHVPGGVAQDFRRTAVTMLESVGISGSSATTRPARPERDRPALRGRPADRGQHHDLPHRDQGGRAAAGTYATFMPKPFTAHPGSGMHTHFSLFEGDTNAFYEAGAEFQLSETARQFIAGILKHAPEFTAVPTSS